MLSNSATPISITHNEVSRFRLIVDMCRKWHGLFLGLIELTGGATVSSNNIIYMHSDGTFDTTASVWTQVPTPPGNPRILFINFSVTKYLVYASVTRSAPNPVLAVSQLKNEKNAIFSFITQGPTSTIFLPKNALISEHVDRGVKKIIFSHMYVHLRPTEHHFKTNFDQNTGSGAVEIGQLSQLFQNPCIGIGKCGVCIGAMHSTA